MRKVNESKDHENRHLDIRLEFQRIEGGFVAALEEPHGKLALRSAQYGPTKVFQESNSVIELILQRIKTRKGRRVKSKKDNTVKADLERSTFSTWFTSKSLFSFAASCTEIKPFISRGEMLEDAMTIELSKEVRGVPPTMICSVALLSFVFGTSAIAEMGTDTAITATSGNISIMSPIPRTQSKQMHTLFAADGPSQELLKGVGDDVVRRGDANADNGRWRRVIQQAFTSRYLEEVKSLLRSQQGTRISS